jgi:hypothetical protein
VRLSLNQRKVLAEFCANFAVAWLAGGIIGPYVSGLNPNNIIQIVLTSVLSAGILMMLMLSLVKGDYRK